MSIFHANSLVGAAGVAQYEIQRSVRFNSADSAYLSRTPSVDGNRKTWTWSGWVKRCKTGQAFRLFDQDSYPNYTICGFTNDKLYCLSVVDNGLTVYMRQSVAVYRDTSAWYHITIVHDTTDVIASNRYRLYVNGSLVATELGLGSYSYPAQNTDGNVNAALTHYINYVSFTGGSSASDGYLADIHFIDGQALDPTSFGAFDTNGVWQPKAYTGTYGTNGFHLPFSDNSTAAALGTDTSGNSNTWTVNNLSVAAGAGNDSLVDTPTNYGTDTGAGGEVRGNYCTWNPLFLGSGYTLVDGNLQINGTTANNIGSTSTFSMTSGKWYWEVLVDAIGSGGDWDVGIANNDVRTSDATVGVNAGFGWRSGGSFRNGACTTYVSAVSYTTGNTLRFAFDADTRNFWVGKDASWLGGGNPATATNPTGQMNSSSNFFAAIRPYGTGSRGIGNFGQRPFAYPAPSGFKALNTANLPTPTIADGSTAMDVVTYTGNGSTQTISGLEISPDLVWIKNRSAATSHFLFDVIRGANASLNTDGTFAEQTNRTDRLTAFTDDGFTLGADAGQGVNYSGAHVAWAWDAGSSTVTNNDGTITSQVRANPSAGFSIVTYTGNRTAGATVGHGLGIAPQLIFIKSRAVSGFGWRTYHASVGNTKYLLLNSTAAADTFSGDWNNTTPGSSVFTLGTDGGSGNYPTNDTTTYVAYCFAPVESYSAFGSYTGNGSASSGPFVYLGFRPRWVLIKNKDNGTSSSDWWLFDSVRGSINANGTVLYPNRNYAEYSGTTIFNMDFLSNGFRLSSATNPVNQWGQTHVYCAFAENPFSLARAR